MASSEWGDHLGPMGAPSRRMYLLTKGVAFEHGVPKALCVGTAGTANVTDMEGNVCNSFPLQAGYNPIRISALAIGGSAGDIWGLY